jgi:uncharacterized protein YecE (DUF72 family)
MLEAVEQLVREHPDGYSSIADVVARVGLSREEPAYKTDILYTRLFGKGKYNIYQFTNKELEDINKKATGTEHRKIIVSFHGSKCIRTPLHTKSTNKQANSPK